LLDAAQASSERQAKKANRSGSRRTDEELAYPIRWREKDKKTLLERVKEKYTQLMKLKLTIIYVDPMRKILAREERNKRKEEADQKAEVRKRERKI